MCKSCATKGGKSIINAMKCNKDGKSIQGFILSSFLTHVFLSAFPPHTHKHPHTVLLPKGIILMQMKKFGGGWGGGGGWGSWVECTVKKKLIV